MPRNTEDIPFEREIEIQHNRSYTRDVPVIETGSNTDGVGVDSYRWFARLNLGQIRPRFGEIVITYTRQRDRKHVAERKTEA